MAAESEIAVGIDLGTSNSCVAAVRASGPEVLRDSHRHLIHSSVVAFMPDGRVLVGNPAKRHMLSDPANTIYSAKRLMGRFFFSDEVRKAKARAAYSIVEGPNSSVRIAIRNHTLSPQEIGALVLKRMRTVAQKATRRRVKKAVVTVPAYFNDNQRQATRDAAEIAGLEALRIINEPTAAALAYGYGRDLSQRLAVYDLGGGTFDVSILEIGTDIYEVLSTAGDTYLGGDDFDQRIVNHMVTTFHQETGIDLRNDPKSGPALMIAAEQAKIGLSRDESVAISLPEICKDDAGRFRDLSMNLSTREFSRMSMDLIQRTFKVTDEALQAAKMIASDLDGVIMVGGPTRLPFIRQAVEHYFQSAPKAGVNPDQVVALGAALQAHSLEHDGPPTMLLDVTPLTLRIGTVGDYTEAIIEKNTPIPLERTRTFTTTIDGQEMVMVRILQGEDRSAKECELLGEFEFSGLRPAPRGAVRIEVTFEIDVNGIVHVSAKDLETGRIASTTINLSSGLSDAEREASQARAENVEMVAVDP